MPDPAFDPSGAVRFDLKTGTASDPSGTRLVLVPAAALASLERSAPDALASLGAAVGSGCGARVAARLGGEAGVRAASLETVVTHLAGELAIAGLGAVHLERWGRAMVLVVESPGVASDAFVTAALSSALGAATGRGDVAVTRLGGEASAARYFVGAEATAARVSSRIAEGTPWAEALAELQGRKA